MSGTQLALGVRLRDDARWANFHGGRNATAAGMVRNACGDPAHPLVVLCGDEDTGKSHLLQAACHEYEQRGQSAVCFSLAELEPLGPDALSGVEVMDLVALDDVHRVLGKPAWEEALFHLYNRARDLGHQVMLTLNDTPVRQSFVLPDLRSRFQEGLLVQLGTYRDDDRITILRLRAEQRGLVLSDEVAGFILRRSSRRLGALLAILDQLDENSLQAQRRLTIPFIKSVMGW
ncbi:MULTISPECIES: DnaA regulatory inactivator Hda [Marinobacter]|uniref:Regulatory inactivation of DnaA Hda protein n=1 Tax=Marinobacter segnicrescens TaxID=430453 RepID=A0A1H9YNC7_9GAMM|nr:MULTISPECIES: DnaA regulatory inactivator Hda [Marinobacter]UZD64338.1 DnaA regulatory inactivator Hda [Marinobacter sp. AN1]SES70560.1 regulatory inactivation of DnaA Hda protein [Marinobacter segnicrescens]